MRGVFWIQVKWREIYIKELDELPPRLFFDSGYCLDGRALKSFLDGKYLLCFSSNRLAIIPIQDNLSHGQVRRIKTRDIKNIDITSFKNNLFILAETKLSYARMKKNENIEFLHELKFEKFHQEYFQEKRDLEEIIKLIRAEKFSICDKGKFILVYSSKRISINKNCYDSSIKEKPEPYSLVIYDITKYKLNKRAFLDLNDFSTYFSNFLTFLKYCGNRIYFIALGDVGLFTYYYHMENQTLVQVSYEGEKIAQSGILKLVKKEEGVILGISRYGKMLSIQFN